jgi:hypothetical protein
MHHPRPTLRLPLAIAAGVLAVVTHGAAAEIATPPSVPRPASVADAAAAAESNNNENADDDARASFLHPGEVLVFRLSWGIFSNAGQLRIETTEEDSAEHGKRIRVRIHTKSKGLISAVFPVDSNADAFIDPATGRPLLIERSGKEGDRDTRTTTVYDYTAMRVKHTDHNRARRSGEADLPEEPAYDTFVVMMLARTWALKPGEKRTVYGSFEDDIYQLEATGLAEDRIKTPAGRFDVQEIELKQLGELKGFFKKGGTVRFFISKGENPQIVRIELGASAGTFVMQLEKVEQASPADQGN